MHDHSQNTHSMNCPVSGCTYQINVHAHGDEEAVLNLMAMTQEHISQAHPDTNLPSSVDLLSQVQANLRSTG